MGIGINPTDTVQVQKTGYANYAHRAQDEPIKEGGVNFEGRKDYDSFEKKESHTGRNVAIGTGVGLALLYGVAAILGRGKAKGGMEWLTKNSDKGIKKYLNVVVDRAYTSAKWIKTNTWGRFGNKKGGNAGTPPTPPTPPTNGGGATPPAVNP